MSIRRALAGALLLAVSMMAAAEWEILTLDVPAGPGAMAPSLAAGADGSALASWLEPRSQGGHRLRFARRGGDGLWSEARTIAEGDDWFANWADFPAMVELGDGTLVAHWLEKSGPATFAYDIRVTRSLDGGATWTDPITPHEDGTETEHGFVSLLPVADDALRLVWLDGRAMAGHSHDHAHSGHPDAGRMALRTRQLWSDGRMDAERVLDDSVCECCQTAAGVTDRGALVIYRNRSAEELRDIWSVTEADGNWSAPRPVYEDGWQISGCPVNGPALATWGDRAAAVWFTAAGARRQVRLAFSADAGDTFGPPQLVDAETPVGRVAIVPWTPETVLVSWLAEVPGAARILIQEYGAEAAAGPVQQIGESSAARAAGFPRLLRQGDQALMLWTDPTPPGRLQAALVRPTAAAP